MPLFSLTALKRPTLALVSLGLLGAALAAPKATPQSIIVSPVTPGGPSITGVTLINADSNQPVPGYDPIPPAATLDLSKLPPRLNLRANTSGQVGSVRFGLDGQTNRTLENLAPFALCGGSGNDYSACAPAVLTPGGHQLSATPFTLTQGKGAAGTGVLLNFTVVRPQVAQPNPPASANLSVASLTLINADTDRPVPGFDPIPAGAVLRLSALPRHLNVRANTSGGVGSVRFAWTTGKTYVENQAPFALCVDGRFKNGQKGDYYACDASVFAPGTHRITATPFSKMYAQGGSGPALTWDFTVTR